MGYKAIQCSFINARVINARLIAIWEALEELKALTGQLPDSENETVSVETEAQEVVINEAQESGFDWQGSDNVEALKAFAREKYGLNIRKFKIESVRAEIASFIETL